MYAHYNSPLISSLVYKYYLLPRRFTHTKTPKNGCFISNLPIINKKLIFKATLAHYQMDEHIYFLHV
jgi:hypothetical protein